MIVIGDKSFHEINEKNWFDVMAAITALPPAVTQTHINEPLTDLSAANKARVQEANEALKNWQGNPSTEAFEDTVQLLTKFSTLCEEEGDPLGKMHHLQTLGILYDEKGDYGKSIDTFIDAINLAGDTKYFEAQHFSLGKVYSVLIKAINLPSLDENTKRMLNETLSTIREKANIASYRSPNAAPMNLQARSIGQKQVGFTYPGGPIIGTYNIQDCIGVVVQHPEKIALTHIDARTKTNSLKYLFNSMPPSSDLEPLKLTVVGARFPGERTCEINLFKILKHCADNNISIKIESANIFDHPTQASTIVVDPTQTPDTSRVKIIEQVAMADYRDVALETALTSLTAGEQDLQISLDTTISEERAPPLVYPEVGKKLIDAGDTENSIYAWCKKNLGNEALGESDIDFGLANRMNGMMLLKRRYREAIIHIMDTGIAVQADKLQGMDPRGAGGVVKIDPDATQAAFNAITQCPIYVGKHANDGNQRLIDKILTPGVLFILDRSNPSQPIAKFNPDALKHLQSVSHPEQPYEIIKEKARQSQHHQRVAAAKTHSSQKSAPSV